jgi:phosphoribosylanthranilate isomerase
LVKVKICGITNLEDALNSVNAGCDALGFVFYHKSPRYIIPEKAKQIIKYLPAHILKIGVFVNAREKNIKRIARLCGLDILQFHGNESADFCRKFNGYKIIKAFRVRDRIVIRNLSDYKNFAYLFDTFTKAKAGGTGRKFDWNLVRHLDGLHKPVFLSGGLNVDNVKEAMKQVRPTWVDVSSSVEVKPGKKDQKKVREFINAVKSSSAGKQVG